MARTPMTFSKRQREQAKRDKKTAKAERKALRKSGVLPEGDVDDDMLEAADDGENDEDSETTEENSTETAVAQ
jgi:hypothetical protein